MGDSEKFIRLSSVLRSLRAEGTPIALQTADKMERMGKVSCDVHGPLSDPIVVEANETWVFGCRDCSGEAVQERYDAEGSDAPGPVGGSIYIPGLTVHTPAYLELSYRFEKKGGADGP